MRLGLGFLAAVAVSAAIITPADAQVTACLTPGGTLVNVVQGENPPGHACKENQIPVVLGGDSDTRKFIFISEFFGPGDLGGISGANQICQSEADAADLPGLYKAWLSSVSSGPRATFRQARVPYVLPGSLSVVADDWNDLVDGELAHRIDEHADGTSAGASSVWTGTTSEGMPFLLNNNNGTGQLHTCANWNGGAVFGLTGIIGSSVFTDSRWTNLSTGLRQFCGLPRRIYCVQQ